jgi:hypothetical protein
LAQRPDVRKVDKEIAELERRLRLLRLVRQVLEPDAVDHVRAVPGSEDATRIDQPSLIESDTARPSLDRHRFSAERVEILRVMLAAGGTARPADVVKALRARGIEKGHTPILTNMSRMAKFGLLTRVGPGLYRVTDEAAAFVREMEREHPAPQT